MGLVLSDEVLQQLD
jgi:hypothetical protein